MLSAVQPSKKGDQNMTDHPLSHAGTVSTIPLAGLLSRLRSFFKRNDAAEPCLDLSPSNRARLERGLPGSDHSWGPAALKHQNSCDAVRDRAINTASRHGIPL